MDTRTDGELLADYTARGSEPAFAELVRRHVDLVYSAALRLVTDTHAAKDVTQGVFIALAAKAPQLAKHPVLCGWLHCTVRNLAAKSVRSDVRRQAREQQAVIMNVSPSDQAQSAWEQIVPHLDTALGELPARDREAVMLRYFEKKSAPEIAAILHISTDAAQKRVSRALERMREIFAQRGVAIGAGSLAVTMTASAVQGAPPGLVLSTISAVTLTSAAVSSIVTSTSIRTIAMTTLQKSFVTAAIAVLAGLGIYEASKMAVLRSQLRTLEQQRAPLTAEVLHLQARNKDLSRQLIVARESQSLSSERLRELLRLRGEVGLFRERQRDMEKALSARIEPFPQKPQITVNGQSQPSASPFQIQLVTAQTEPESLAVTNESSNGTAEVLYIQKAPLLDHTAISRATVEQNASSGSPELNIQFSDLGKDLFAAITRENLDKRFAIVLNGQIYSAPVIRSEITGGQAKISGDFSEREAEELATKINEAIAFRPE